MKPSKIKNFFLKNGLNTDNKEAWKIVITDDLIVKQTEKAVMVKNPTTLEALWIPKKCLEPVENDVENEPVSMPDFSFFDNQSSEPIPDKVQKMLEKCKNCGCYNDGKCVTYDMKPCFALLLCLQNDIEAKDHELEFLNSEISRLETENDIPTGQTPFTF